MEEHKPDAVIMLGQAGGRPQITMEKIAINYRNARILGNKGNMPKEEKIFPDGPDGIFSSLPVEAMKEEKVPASMSYSAGTYVCNDLMYSVLHYIKGKGLNTKAGFIHVPFCQTNV